MKGGLLAHLLKAFILFVFGFAILANLGDALEKKPQAAVSATSAAFSRTTEPHASIDAPKYEIKTYEPAEKPLETKPVAMEGSYAQICATFDPIEHPEHVIPILELASTTGTSVGALYAVGRIETGHVDGAGKASGGCDFLEQAKIRCELGRGVKFEKCSLYTATKALSERFSWASRGMTCSCGTSTWDNNTGNFGGCCGPFQFTSDEIDKNALKHGLDPMTFCGGAILAGMELKDHHDKFVRQGLDDNQAWQRAISRYYGADREGKYWRKAHAQWKQFHSWYAQGPDVLRKKVTEKYAASAAYHRKLRAARTTNP